jgi:hypothetical protein
MSTLKDDIIKGALSPEDATDKDLWRSIHGAKRPTRVNLEMLYRCCFTYGGAIKPTCVCALITMCDVVMLFQNEHEAILIEAITLNSSTTLEALNTTVRRVFKVALAFRYLSSRPRLTRVLLQSMTPKTRLTLMKMTAMLL